MDELDFERELSLLYNHKPDDSPQFTRWQMHVAIRHGINLAGACKHCGQTMASHEPSGCCGDGGGSTFSNGADQ